VKEGRVRVGGGGNASMLLSDSSSEVWIFLVEDGSVNDVSGDGDTLSWVFSVSVIFKIWRPRRVLDRVLSGVGVDGCRIRLGDEGKLLAVKKKSERVSYLAPSLDLNRQDNDIFVADSTD
jgi:hypothetical protein